MIRLPLASLVLAGALTGALSVLPAESETPSSTPIPSPTAAASATPEPTASALPTPRTTPIPSVTAAPGETPAPAPWAPPAGYAGPLKPGVWVRVANTGSCLNVRVSPGLSYPDFNGGGDVPTMNCLPDGFVGRLSDVTTWSSELALPVQADGHWWWDMIGQGWVAQDWLEFVQDSGSPYAPRPELAGAGLLAVSRNDGVWLVAPDGAEERHILALNDQSSVNSLDWSPDGVLLAVSYSDWATSPGITKAVLIDGAGTLVAEYPDLTQVRWSPAGTHLSGLQSRLVGEFGGFFSVPVVIDRATGAVTQVGALDYNYTGPEWSPDGAAFTFICRSSSWQEWQPDGTYVDRSVDCAGDGLRVVPLDGGEPRVVLPMTPDDEAYYTNPSWSPDGKTIALYGTGVGAPCDGYVLIDAESGGASQCFALPDYSSFGGGCGGSSETGASDWGPDGRTLAYHWQFRQGENGVALVDVATGQRRMILSTGASSVSFSPDGRHLAFAGAGYIWLADADGSGAELLTEGWLTAWQPDF